MEPAPDTQHRGIPRRLCRSTSDRMVAGVAAGTAEYLGVDPTTARVGFTALALLGGAGFPLYLAAWLLLPEEGADHSVADDLLGRVGMDWSD